MVNAAAKLIRNTRKKLKITLTELSNITGISVSQLSKIETGERRLRDVKQIVLICNALYLDANEMYKLIYNDDKDFLYEAESTKKDTIDTLNIKANNDEEFKLKQKIINKINMLNSIAELETIYAVISSFADKYIQQQNYNNNIRKEKAV